jgi:hypothetical protein
MMLTSDLDHLSRRFRRYAEREFPPTAPLYATLSEKLADDSRLLALLLNAPPDQRWPTLFFAAVHYLLLRDSSDDLAAFFPDITTSPLPPTRAYPMFHRYCDEHAQELGEIFSTRTTQTNAVGRSAYLLPALSLVEQTASKPLALIDVGASAGFNLLLDQYYYIYGENVVGDPQSPVQLQPELRAAPPASLLALPKIQERLGIDLNPIDAHDDDAILWLRACIWPSHLRRIKLLDGAVQVARSHPPPLIKGDALEMLRAKAAEMPPDCALCIVHTSVLPYFSNADRVRWARLLEELAQVRDYSLVFSEDLVIARLLMPTIPWAATHIGDDAQPLGLVQHANGKRSEKLLALSAPHGQWLDWREPKPASTTPGRARRARS